MKLRIISLGLLLFLFSFSCFVFSDVIHLKNGRRMEGIIEKETKEKVILNVGFGKVTLNRNEIDHIEKYSPQKQSNLRKKWSGEYFLRPEFVPPAFKAIASNFIALEKLRSKAIRKKALRDKVINNLNSLEKEFEQLSDMFIRVNKRLAKFKAENSPGTYNSLIGEFNSLIANMNLNDSKQKKLMNNLSALDKDISQYASSLRMVKVELNRIHNASDRGGDTQEENFLSTLFNRLSIIEGDFMHHSINYKRYGSTMMVEVLLNGYLDADFIVDTGASTVVITKPVADRLGIEFSESGPFVYAKLADGRSVATYPITLKSVQVGNARVKDVRAVVMNSDDIGGDGLLGMTFLDNFIMNIDPKNKKLILEEPNL